MSGSKSSSKSQSQQQSQSYLDPQIVGTLMGNYGNTQNFANGDTYHPLTGAQVQSYFSPYVGQAVTAATNSVNNQVAQQQAQNGLEASASGAFNGDRAGVQDAVTANLGAQTLASTVSNLENEGYQQATQTAQAENQQANNFPIELRQLINQSLGLVGNPVLSQSSGSSSGSSSSFGFSLPNPAVPTGG